MSPVVKKRRERKKIPPKYLLLIFTVLCMGLMMLTYTRDFDDSFLEDTAGFVLLPMQKGFVKLSRNIIDRAEMRRSIEELNAENKRLQDEIDELSRENAQLMQDHYELSGLRELYELDSSYSEYEKTGARIIAANTGTRFNSFIIDKGSEDGIETDMNVIAGSGLVGIVVKTGKNWARVNAIISDDSNVSATVLHTQDNLIVSGDAELIEQGMIRYSRLIDRSGAVVTGDKVVTSNISDKYLPGILIGYISTIDKDSNQLTASGQIQPVVDFEHLSDVLVIKQLKPEMEE
ncbi:MAG: rod shape-determining protein MreC [Lachnospiraceae bacterium]|nr:rod shape-determining protein MreC [Lachnospiraceae bacterium]